MKKSIILSFIGLTIASSWSYLSASDKTHTVYESNSTTVYGSANKSEVSVGLVVTTNKDVLGKAAKKAKKLKKIKKVKKLGKHLKKMKF
ncbi:MAG: hypothetical protein AB7R69_01055 [Candidatus Babeliales bacterium]